MTPIHAKSLIAVALVFTSETRLTAFQIKVLEKTPKTIHE